MPGYPEITRASEIMARRAAEAAEKAAAEESALKLAVEPEREFIDSVDSWTIDVPEELLKLATQLRMNIEVRVWRQ